VPDWRAISKITEFIRSVHTIHFTGYKNYALFWRFSRSNKQEVLNREHIVYARQIAIEKQMAAQELFEINPTTNS